ncbi:hypothetical protein [Pseudonocardia spirodelae]|uniref:DUF124 domain-containing protein n=1 Tax=Pseudonocardia spirodelae TaxID=3133431 RepID=A0ABU8T2B8_9PSEU
MRQRVTGGVGRACALALLLTTVLGGCASTVPGTPWPAGRGPAAPVDPLAAPTTTGGPPTAFTVPGPLPTGPSAPSAPTTTPTPAPGRPTTTVLPVPVTPDGTRTVPPVPVGGGTATVPDGRARPSAAAPAPTGGTGAPSPAAPLTSDVVADECLLDTASLTGLLGGAPVAPAANAVVTRSDGTRTRACFALADGVTVSVNVYATTRTTPVRYVGSATGAAPLTGVPAGTAAAVLDTVAGPTLQLGTARRLVTVAVAGRTPTPQQWRAAAASAVRAAR